MTTLEQIDHTDHIPANPQAAETAEKIYICVAGHHQAEPEDLKATLVGHICSGHAQLCAEATADAKLLEANGNTKGVSGRIRKATQRMIAMRIAVNEAMKDDPAIPKSLTGLDPVLAPVS